MILQAWNSRNLFLVQQKQFHRIYNIYLQTCGWCPAGDKDKDKSKDDKKEDKKDDKTKDDKTKDDKTKDADKTEDTKANTKKPDATKKPVVKPGLSSFSRRNSV